jgi:protein O-mannosyl-transferase
MRGKKFSPTKENKRSSTNVPAKTTPPAAQSKFENHGRKFFIGSAVIVLLSFIIYFPALQGEFLWDDLPVFIEHPIIISPNGLETIWLNTVWLTTDFPLTLTVFWLEHRLWGNNPIGYHVLNLLLHAFNTILLWRILLRLKIRGAFLAALIFAVHPVCVASVAWISELKNTLSLVFFLLSLLSYLRSGEITNNLQNSEPGSRPSTFAFYFLSVVAFFLALLSKTSIVGLPVVLLGIAWWRHGRITRRDVFKSVPFFLLSFGFGLLTIYAQKVNAIRGEIVQTEPFLARLAESAWAIWFYLWKILIPLNLSPIYPHWALPKISLLAFLPLAALAGIVFLLWQKRETWGRHGMVALGFFVVMLLPVLGFIDMFYLIISRVADHWQYVPLIGVVIFVVAGISYLLEEKLSVMRNARIGLGTAIVFFLCILTWNHAKVYANEEMFWRITIKKNPKAWMAYNNLGGIFRKKGRFEESVFFFTESIRLKTNLAETYNDLGHALAKLGRHEEAMERLQTALKLKPNYDEANNNLGISLAAVGKINEAIMHYKIALAENPKFAEAHNNLGIALMTEGNVSGAIEHLRASCKLKPDYLIALNGLAWILATHPDPEFRNGTEAVQLASHAIKLIHHQNAGILETLAAAQAEVGDFSKALESAQAALRLAKAGTDETLTLRLDSQLRMYESKQAFRDSSLTEN